jgi:hypothetical protein
MDKRAYAGKEDPWKKTYKEEILKHIGGLPFGAKKEDLS